VLRAAVRANPRLCHPDRNEVRVAGLPLAHWLCACGAVSAVAPTAAVLGLGRFGSGVAIGGLVVAAFTHLVRPFLSLLALSLLMVALLPSFSLSLLRNRSSPARSPIGHR
jgi:hypothetical protein